MNGLDIDPSTLVADISNQLATTVIDHTRHSTGYIADQLAALPRLISDVCGMEREQQASLAAADAVRQRASVPTRHALVTTPANARRKRRRSQ
jgi:hypothetical protein